MRTHIDATDMEGCALDEMFGTIGWATYAFPELERQLADLAQRALVADPSDLVGMARLQGEAGVLRRMIEDPETFFRQPRS